MDSHYSVAIIGSGCAGLSAAVYAARADNDPVVLRGTEPGGQLTLTTEVENYPGFPDGIGGQQLISRMETQAERFGTTIVNGAVEEIRAQERPFDITLSNGDSFSSDAVIVASGASARTLGVPGEDELLGYGVSTCATCDGAFFRGEDMVVVGGGDAACEEATFLTKFADTVYIAHRRDSFRAEAYWENEVMSHVQDGDIEILWNTEVTEVTGSKEDGVSQVHMIEHEDGKPKRKAEAGETVARLSMDVGALFLAIGHTPNTRFLQTTGVETNETGYLQVDAGLGGGTTETSVPGIFGAGDVFDWHYQQAATAVGSGTKAALDVDAYLDRQDSN